MKCFHGFHTKSMNSSADLVQSDQSRMHFVDKNIFYRTKTCFCVKLGSTIGVSKIQKYVLCANSLQKCWFLCSSCAQNVIVKSQSWHYFCTVFVLNLRQIDHCHWYGNLLFHFLWPSSAQQNQKKSKKEPFFSCGNILCFLWFSKRRFWGFIFVAYQPRNVFLHILIVHENATQKIKKSLQWYRPRKVKKWKWWFLRCLTNFLVSAKWRLLGAEGSEILLFFKKCSEITFPHLVRADLDVRKIELWIFKKNTNLQTTKLFLIFQDHKWRSSSLFSKFVKNTFFLEKQWNLEYF